MGAGAATCRIRVQLPAFLIAERCTAPDAAVGVLEKFERFGEMRQHPPFAAMDHRVEEGSGRAQERGRCLARPAGAAPLVRQSKPLPDFTVTTTHAVKLTLSGNVGNPTFVRFLEKIGTEQVETFATHDFLVLDALQRGDPVPDALRPALMHLVELGVVESVGRGRGTRYLLSRSLYAQLQSAGTYTRKRGLDHETNKELLLKHLRGSGESGAPLSDLCLVLPSLSESTVQRLLNELRSEGRVDLAGSRRWSRWHAVQPRAQPPPANA